MADIVEQAHGADPVTSHSTITALVNSTSGTSRAPSSTRSTPPSAAFVSLARVQKLGATMPTLLHHIQPWMERAIADAENRIERKVDQAVNQRLDAFELIILALPAQPLI